MCLLQLVSEGIIFLKITIRGYSLLRLLSKYYLVKVCDFSQQVTNPKAFLISHNLSYYTLSNTEVSLTV